MTSDFRGGDAAVLLLWNSLAHLLTDAVCAAALFGPVRASDADFSLAVIIYNTAAFTTQCLVGLATDRLRRQELLAAIGLAVCACAALLLPGGYLMALAAGLGNSLFHVAGGTVTLKGARSAGPLGVFVAPGALGLALGTLWPGLRAGLCIAALAVSGLLLALRGREAEFTAPTSRGRTPWGAVLLLTLAVAVRAVGGSAVDFPWKAGASMTMLTAAFVFAGKSLGGYVCSRLGASRTALLSIPAAALLTAFCFAWAVPSLAGQLLLNLTMPVTLWLMYLAMPESPGFAFGLAASALWPGTVAGGMISLTGAWRALLILAAFAAGLAAILYSEKKVSEVPK